MLVATLRNSALIALACFMTYWAGKDVNADLINYHLYIADAWARSKYLTDFMGAGPNSYLNPIAYLPFYWMIMANWDSLVIGLVLGAFHGINLILLWEISERILFKGIPRARWFSLISILLAASSPVFVGTLGGTFLEPTLTVFVLGSLLLVSTSCANAALKKRSLLIFGGGLLIGFATGFKLTNIVFLAAIGLSILFVKGVRFKGLVIATIFSIGAIIGYLIANGWWAYHLYQEFGNPFFPFFNEIFKSPDFSVAKLDHDRFKATGITDLLLLPFRMAIFHSWIYVENNAPDIRPALLVLFGLSVTLKTLISRRLGKTSAAPNINIARCFIITFFLCSIALWLWTTSNGRYALPILLLMGPLLMLAIYKTIEKEKFALVVALTALILQAGHALSAGNPRWAFAEWTHHWFEVTASARLKNNPHAFLSLGISESNSVISPFLHPQSTFVSLIGSSYAFRPDGAGHERINQIIKLHKNHLRMLVTISPAQQPPQAGLFNGWNTLLAPWRLKIIQSDCEFLEVVLSPNRNTSDIFSQQLKGNISQISLLSCGLEAGSGEAEETLRERKRLTRVFDRIEQSCPLLFSPRGWQLTKLAGLWQRHYLQSDIVVYARKGRLSLSKQEYGPFDVDMGSVEDWENNRSKFVCERLPRPW